MKAAYASLAFLAFTAVSAAQENRRAEIVRALRGKGREYAKADVDRRAFLLRGLWLAHRETPALNLSQVCRELVKTSTGKERELYAAIATASVKTDPFAKRTKDTIRTLLTEVKGETTLARAVRYFRFLAEIDRLASSKQALVRLLDEHKAHAWVKPQFALWSREKELQHLLSKLAPLGLPNVKGLKRALVWNGGYGWAGGELYFSTEMAWILKEDKTRFDVFTDTLERRSFERGSLDEEFKKEPPQDQNWSKVKGGPVPRFEVQSFEQALVKWIAAGGQSDFGRLFHFSRGGLPYTVEALFHALWADQRGRRGLALRLLATSEEMLQEEQRGRRGLKETLWQSVCRSLALNRWHKAVISLQNGATWADVSKQLKRVVKAFPGTEYTKRSSRMLASLQAQAKARTGYKAPTWKEWLRLSTKDKLRHLVENLADLDGRQHSQPGMCSVFWSYQVFPADTPKPKDEYQGFSTAHRFVEIGWEAVPTLITLIDDKRLTRSVGFWRGFAPSSFYVLTYGDCAVQILERITGKSFYDRTSTSGYPTRDGRSKAIQLKAQAWWAKVGVKGELKILSEEVASGSVRHARILVERYPKKALKVLSSSIKKAASAEVRAQLVEIVAGIEKPDPTSVLKSEAMPDRALPVRLAAARGLLRRGQREVIAELIHTWNHMTDAPDGYRDLIQVLLESRDLRALQALGRDLELRSVDVSSAVLSSLPPENKLPKDAQARRRYQAALEELLVGALSNERKNNYGKRLCDLAGEELASRWPKRYAFLSSESVARRDRQLNLLRNVWRKARGQPPLPIPGEASLSQTDARRLNNALDRLCKGEIPAKAEIEALGPSALSAVEARLKVVGKSHAASKSLADLASRLALTVSHVQIGSRGVKPSAAWRKRLLALRGRRLGEGGVVDLLVSAATSFPKTSRGLELRLDRVKNGRGVLVKATFLSEEEALGQNPPWLGNAPEPPAAGRVWEEVHGTGTSPTVVFQRVGGPVKAFQEKRRHAIVAEVLGRCVRLFHGAPIEVKVRFLFGSPLGPVKAPGKRRLDRYGYPLPRGAVSRIGSKRFRQPSAISALRVSPDGKTIATGSHDGVVRLWDSETGVVRASFPADGGFSEFVAFSRDGHTLLGGSSHGGVHVFDVVSGQSVLDLDVSLVEDSNSVSDLALAPDGKSFVSTTEKEIVVRRWSTQTGALVDAMSLKSPDGEPGFECAAYSPNGKTVALVDTGGRIRIWKPGTPKTRDLVRVSGGVKTVAWAPDSRLLATVNNKGVNLVSIATGKVVRTLPSKAPAWSACDLAFSPSGKYVAACQSGARVVVVRETATGGLVHRIRPRGMPRGVAFAPDGKALVTGTWGSNVIQFWDTATGQEIKATKAGNLGPIKTLASTRDGSMLLVGTWSGVRWLKRSTTQEVRTLRAPGGLLCFATTPDRARILTGGGSGRVVLWDSKTLKPVWAASSGTRTGSVALSADASVVAAIEWGGPVHVWKTGAKGNKPLLTLNRPSPGAIALSSDGKTLAVGEGLGTVTLFKVRTGVQIRSLNERQLDGAQEVAYSPDGKVLASGHRSGTVYLWDAVSGKKLRTLSHGQPVHALAFSSSGNLLAVGQGGVAVVWDRKSGRTVHKFTGHGNTITDLVFLPSGKRLVSASGDGTILEWDVSR